ncbi:MAG: Arc family DNA binding domain-containing protein [Terrimonas sp.]|nr:Arc family DNA binding domain-containing protein [Terrimonas sp.]
MSQKKSFVIRIDNDTYKALEKWAADEFRSVNGQIEYLLFQQLQDAGRVKKKDSRPDKPNPKNQ